MMSMFTANGTIVLGDRLKQSYKGETDAEGVRHGQGVYTYANSVFKYEGEYIKGEKHGKGRLTLSDGSYFEGTFQNNEIVGHGTRVYSDGSRYEGLFAEGEATGQGVYSSSQGWKIEANFINNRPVGHGKWENVDGDIYEGGFNGKFAGQGSLRRSNGYVFDGQWSAGMKHGHGFEESAGETYTGDFHNDKRHGTGTLTTADGKAYTGVQFCNGSMEQTAGRLSLEYPKNVDKKGVELPVAIEAGIRVPAEFVVNVAVQISARDSRAEEERQSGAEEERQADAEAGEWKVFAKESGRRVTVRLHHGHPKLGEELQDQVQGDVLGAWIMCSSEETAVDGEASGPSAVESQATEQLKMAPEAHLSTDAGVCAFRDFQIGDGECDVAAGPYTMVFSSDGLDTQTVAVAVGVKGKGK